jgi:peptidoglycan/LPS O-acetylase OafA/YrhL
MHREGNMTGSGYRPEIDGLRALAVVPVVMFHLGLGFPGGFVGVDVFFVISGFLITGIIRRGIEHESFSLAEFWERRIRRIFPALFVMVVATLAVGSWLLLPNELEELGMSSVAQAFLLANVYFWRDTNYFAGPAEFKPLLHTWSLAVEEQFYLFFPLVLSFFRQLSRKKLFALFTAVALTSFAGSVYGAFFHAGATFFLLPTRAWELLIGCMLAVFPW